MSAVDAWLMDATSSDATGFYEAIGVSFTRSSQVEAVRTLLC